MVPANPLYHGPHRGIGNVFTIPGKKIIHAIYSCNRNMKSINFSSNWNRAVRNKCLA